MQAGGRYGMKAHLFALGRFTAVSVGLGVLFAWLGVYGTGFLPFFERAVYWTSTHAVGAGTALLAAPLVFERLGRNWPLWVQLPALALIVSVPVTVVVVLFTTFAGGARDIGAWITQFGYIFVISQIVTAVGYGIYRLSTAPAPGANPSAAPAADGLDRFRERLPMKLRQAALWAVSAEDHYLRVHTSAGEDLILLRLSDALAELAALDGLQTHRSWWVAREGVSEIQRSNGRMTIRLKSGKEAPVSRTFQPQVRDRGWS